MKRSTVHFFFGLIAAFLLALSLWLFYALSRNQEVINAVLDVPDTLSSHNPDASTNAHPAVVLRTANALSKGNEFDDAEALYVKLADRNQKDELSSAARFNLANHYLKEGLRSDLPGAQTRPLIEIAKQRYRDLLLVEPEHWGARVNLEHALRAAPELPDTLFDKRPPIKSVNVVVPDFTLKDLP